MTTMTKFLALLPVVAFAAACNAVSPAGPDASSSPDATEASGSASAASRRGCTGLKEIQLTIDDSADTMIWVDATYHFDSPLSGPCAPPQWKSDRIEMQTTRSNPFRVGFHRMIGGAASVSATAPSGVSASIDLNFSDPARSPQPRVCPNVVGITLSLEPGRDTQVVIAAAYVYGGPLSTPCGVAPSWVADRRGLGVDVNDPFRAAIDPDVTVKTVVTATAPNGIAANIGF